MTRQQETSRGYHRATVQRFLSPVPPDRRTSTLLRRAVQGESEGVRGLSCELMSADSEPITERKGQGGLSAGRRVVAADSDPYHKHTPVPFCALFAGFASITAKRDDTEAIRFSLQQRKRSEEDNQRTEILDSATLLRFCDIGNHVMKTQETTRRQRPFTMAAV